MKADEPSPRRPDASAEIARLDRAAKHHHTPSGNGHMVWREWGTGSPVVLAHGGFGSWLHWIRNIEALAAHHRVIAFDTPGLGDSAHVAEPITPERIGETVYNGLNTLLEPDEACQFVCFSFGGVVTSQVALHLKNRLKRIILVGASGLGIPRTQAIDMVRRTPDMSIEEREAAQRHNIMALMLRYPENLDDLALEIQARNDDKARMSSRKFSLGAAVRDALPHISGEVDGIWGQEDVTALPEIDARWAVISKTHPNTDFRIIPRAGHWVAYEASEKFNKIALEMLSKG